MVEVRKRARMEGGDLYQKRRRPLPLLHRAEGYGGLQRPRHAISGAGAAVGLYEEYYLDVQEATNSHYYQTKENQFEKWTELRDTRDWTELEK